MGWGTWLAKAAFGLAIVSVGAGCATTTMPLTKELRDQHGLSEKELQGLQYYNSHEIVLRRELRADSREITGSHKLLLTSGKTIEEIVIPAETPGVAVEVTDTMLKVSFSPGTSLEFSLDGTLHEPQPVVQHEPDPFPGSSGFASPPGGFSSSGEGGGNFWLAIRDGDNSVLFGGRRFEAVETTLQSHLLIDAESLDEVVESRTVLEGIEL